MTVVRSLRVRETPLFPDRPRLASEKECTCSDCPKCRASSVVRDGSTSFTKRVVCLICGWCKYPDFRIEMFERTTDMSVGSHE